MLRLNGTIKLNVKELNSLQIVADAASAPKTVQEHNRQLDDAVEVYVAEDTPESRLLAAIAQDMKIPD